MSATLAFMLDRLTRLDASRRRRHDRRMSRDKLRRILALLAAEAESPGPRSDEVVARLRELASLYRDAAAPRDHRLVRALALMSDRLAEPWTVEALAAAVGMSRAAFARRFVAAFGVAPLQHLHEQRMETAAALLRDTEQGLAAIAAQVGYASEFAFSRAFKRHHGLSPSVYRRGAATMQAGMRLAA
jgi:AraC-like DNA-binding protein